jgi:hypothetical protein
MKIIGLVARIRSEFLDDAKGRSESQFLWPTRHIIASLSQAERELCHKLFLLHDSTTVEICHLTVAAINGVFPRDYAIDDRILRIERLKFPGVTKPLERKTTAWLDQNDSGWDEAKGTPSFFTVDSGDYIICFNRQPISGGTATMTVKRLPLVSLIEKSQNDSPEIKQLDDEIIHGALKYLFIKPELEGYDPDLSAKWALQFEADIKQITQNRAAMNPQVNICRPERF